MSITLSPAAAEYINKTIDKRGHGLGLRLKITATGCSGFGYLTDYADEVSADDLVFESNGAKVVIDQKSYALVKGTHVDYQQKGLNWAYVFNNPQAAGECGCGESFSVEQK